MKDGGRRRRWALTVVGVATAMGTALVLVAYAPARRAVVEPLTWALADLRRSLAAVPEALLWGGILLIGYIVLLVSWRRLVARARPRPTAPRPTTEPHPRDRSAVAALAQDLARARRRQISRRRVVRELSVLAVRLVARHEGLPLPRARELVTSGDWPDDPRVRRLLGSRRDDRSALPRDAFLDAVRHTVTYLEHYHQEV